VAQRFICRQCGTQFADSEAPPSSCPICEDDRQYVRWEGQDWVTLDDLRQTHSIRIAEEADGITGFGVTPAFAIDQRALLLRSPAGNVLWDCISLVTEEAVAEVTKRGGLSAIAISHPHFYSAMVEWSDAFGGVPIYIHEAERQWVQRPAPAIRFWSGETHVVNAEMTLVRCGGHFPGGQVLHWSAAAGGGGAIFTGDIVMVVMDRRHVSFMHSFPNIVPLNRAAVERIAAALEPFAFDAVFGGWWNRVIPSDGKAAVARSVARYLKAIAD
jgi:glyoxylase-like metal-dependent hydrolase (beta-lactamase superfamily II)